MQLDIKKAIAKHIREQTPKGHYIKGRKLQKYYRWTIRNQQKQIIAKIILYPNGNITLNTLKPKSSTKTQIQDPQSLDQITQFLNNIRPHTSEP